jgi:hypothetical protein
MAVMMKPSWLACNPVSYQIIMKPMELACNPMSYGSYDETHRINL